MTCLLLPFIFWGSLAALGYTFAGYPLMMFFLARFRPVRTFRPLRKFPSVTIALAAHNEETRIVARLQNLLAADYPPEKLNILVVSDGSTDGTVRQIETLNNPRVRLIVQLERCGKASALNLALAAADREIIVFADVRQRFAPEAIAELVKHFSDPKTGAVSGELLVDPAVSTVGGGVDVYWRLEKKLRHAEARWDSSIGCTGAIYAIRRGLFEPLPADTILDDVVTPMRIAAKKYRVAFEPLARAFDPQTLEPAREQIRKRRTLAGNYQMLFRHPAWLLPWRNRLWWQLISHKYLRLAAPFFLAILFVSNVLLLEPFGLYAYFWYFHCIFYALAIGGFALHKNCRPFKKSHPFFSLPAGFVFLNWMSLAGLWHYLRRKSESTWELNRPAKN